MGGRFAEAVVQTRRDLTDRIAEFTLALADGTPLPPSRAGAHVELRFGGAEGRFLRHYSLVGPLELGTSGEAVWRIAVQREDRARGSAYIHRQFAPGTRLWISGAQTPFRLSDGTGPVLLIAGGIGVTAMLPMLRSCRMRQVPVAMVYAGRSLEAMAYGSDLRALGGAALTLVAEDRDGRPDFTAILGAQPEGTTVYMCGPAGMMAAVEAAAAGLGWAPERLRREVFNAAHRPEDHPCRVRVRDGREVAVPAGTTLLDALELAGIDTLSDCRRGECGLCVTDLTAAQPIDHRDAFLSEAEKHTNTRIALCCSRPRGDLIDLNL